MIQKKRNNNYLNHTGIVPMVRKPLPATNDAACGPDSSNWHWHRHSDESRSTDYADLLRAKEQWQHEDDEEYVENYYNKEKEKRKHYRENRRERLWQAEERLAMSSTDVKVRKKHRAQVDQHLDKSQAPRSSAINLAWLRTPQLAANFQHRC